MSKEHPIEAEEIPPHMLEEPRNRAQKKAFAKAKRAAKKEAPAKKTAAKKSATTADSGYGMGAGKDEKP